MKLPGWFGEALRFGIVGGLGFCLDAGVLWLTIRAGASPYAGRVLSIALTIVFTWWLNRRLTFRADLPPSWREFARYFIESLGGVAVNYTVYSAVLWAGAPVIVALACGTAVGSTFNFLRYRKLFKPASVVAPAEKSQP